MKTRALHFTEGDAASRAFGVGAPIVCAPDGRPFRIVDGDAELFLQSGTGRHYLAGLGPGDAVFPVLPDPARFILVAREPVTAAPLADDELAPAKARWCARLAAARDALGVGERDEQEPELGLLNAELAAICDDRRERSNEAEIARLKAATEAGEEKSGEFHSIAGLLALCARQLGVPVAGEGPRSRDNSFEGAPGLARRLGLSTRPISLSGDWYRHEQGPLILRWAEDRSATVAIWTRRAYRLADGEALTADLAAAFDRAAYAVSAPLPESVSGFRSLARYVISNNRGELVAIAGAATLVAILGAFIPLATGWILSDIAPSGNARMLFAVGAALFFAALMSYLLETVRGVAVSRIQGKTSSRLSAAIFDRLLRLPTSFFREYSSGDLNQRLAGIDEIRELILSVMLSAGLSAIVSIFYFAVLAYYDFGLALISAGLISVFVLIVVVTRALQVPIIRAAFAIDGQLAERSYEMISSVAKLRTAAAETRALDRWARLYGEERELERKAGMIAGYSSALTDSWQILTQVILFAAVAMLVGDTLDPGSFVAFLIAFGAFQGAFVTLSSELIELYAAQPQIDRALPIMRAVPERSTGRADPGRLVGAISVRDVTFSYEEGRAPIISDVSLDIEPGSHVAIVGGSGAGKSTFLRLLLGFETPGRGHVLYDNQDLSELDSALVRAQIGVVLQASSLFAGSIIENIRGSHDAELEQCLEAADQAGLRRDLDYFPMGVHTQITEGAAVLSGGQRQRILIARALVGRPSILFFDEATSALDNQSQAIVAATLDAMSATRITIAHRLSTIENADKICVLQKGRIIEQGDYRSLMAAGGVFAALAKRQLMEE